MSFRTFPFLLLLIIAFNLAGCGEDSPLDFPEDNLYAGEISPNTTEVYPGLHSESEQIIEEQTVHREYDLNLPLPEFTSESRYVRLEDQIIFDFINNMEWAYNVYLPPSYYESDKEYPILFLLHGYDGHRGVWDRPLKLKSMLDYYDENGLLTEIVVVTLDAKNTYYINKHQAGILYEDYFFEILKPEIFSTYRVLEEPEGCLIGGFSMGGYGATKYMLTHNEFGFCYVMSTPFEGESKLTKIESLRPLFNTVTPEEMPYFIFDVGKSDSFRSSNNRLDRFMDQNNIPHEFILREGAHDEKFWVEGLFIMLDRVNRYIDSSNYFNDNDKYAGI